MRSFDPEELDRIIEMAWEDRTTFEAIEYQFGIAEQEVIELMRQSMKSSSFKMSWWVRCRLMSMGTTCWDKDGATSRIAASRESGPAGPA